MAKGKGGRPTKYRKEFCEMLIEHARKKRSFDTFAGLIEVDPDTLYEWVKVHSEFSEAKKIARAIRNYLVEEEYINQAERPSKDGNAAMMIYWTKNTLGWSDKVEVENNVNQIQRLVIEKPNE